MGSIFFDTRCGGNFLPNRNARARLLSIPLPARLLHTIHPGKFCRGFHSRSLVFLLVDAIGEEEGGRGKWGIFYTTGYHSMSHAARCHELLRVLPLGQVLFPRFLLSSPLPLCSCSRFRCLSSFLPRRFSLLVAPPFSSPPPSLFVHISFNFLARSHRDPLGMGSSPTRV